MHNDPKIIAVDFDGTIVKPEENPEQLTDFVLQPQAKEVLQWAWNHFYLILWTCREGVPLLNALNFLKKNDIKFHAINKNAPFVDFQTSQKIFADQYLDDRAGIGIISWPGIKMQLSKLLEPDDEKIVKEVVAKVIGVKKC
jgi:hydroxymethylpyrimidine pyrophosphatase-like HAD family hydrolase